MVSCSSVCLYTVGKENCWQVAVTDDKSIVNDAKLSLESLVGKCAISDQPIRKAGNIQKHELPDFHQEGNLPNTVIFVPIHGVNYEVLGVLGVFGSPKRKGFDAEDESLVGFVTTLVGYTLENILQFEKFVRKNDQVEYLMKTMSITESHVEHGLEKKIADMVELLYELFNCERVEILEIKGGEVVRTFSRDLQENERNFSGLVAHIVSTGETLNISDVHKDPRFNEDISIKENLEMRSILATPFFDERLNIIGVIQCINKRMSFCRRLSSAILPHPPEIFKTSNERQPKMNLMSINSSSVLDDIGDVPGEPNTILEVPYNQFVRLNTPQRSEVGDTTSNSSLEQEKVAFSNDDELLIKALAKSTGVVILNDRIFQKYIMSQRENQALVHVLQVTATNMALPEMLNEIATATCDIIRAEKVSIFLVDYDEERLCSVVSKGSEIVNVVVPLGQGIAGTCFETREIIGSDDPYNDDRFLKQIDEATGFVTKSILAVPIADAYGNYVGVMQAKNKDDDQFFSTEDEELLQAISNEVGESVRRGLLLMDKEARRLLLPADAKFPWQSAMMEIYSRNYIDDSPRHTFSVPSVRSDHIIQDINFDHTSVLTTLPSFEITEILKLLDSCQFDVLKYDPHVLSDISFLMFANLAILEQFNIPEKTLRSFIAAVSMNYHDHPFHNWFHAVHVLHWTYWCIRSTTVNNFLCDIDICGMLVAAMCHDLNHPGHGSDFEVKTSSELALLYNDVSVLENMHAHATFKLIRQNDLNIFVNASMSDQKELRKIIISVIMATDMTHHKTFTAKLGEKPFADLSFDTEDRNARQFLADIVVHAADISAQVYNWEIAQKWETRINLEFVNQVAKERKCGLTPSPFMLDLDQPQKRYKSQIFFCDVIIKPFWKGLAQLFPLLNACVEQLEKNRVEYEKLLKKVIPVEERKKEGKKGVKIIPADSKRMKRRNKRGSGSKGSKARSITLSEGSSATKSEYGRSSSGMGI